MWKTLAVFLISWLVFSFLPVRFPSETVNELESLQPLHLTPLLEKGNISGAKEVARVKPDIGDTPSFSGYFTVNAECESNLFFWFFPARENSVKAPVILWVQGGPAASSLTSLFGTIGPFSYKEDVGLATRKFSWNNKNNLLFIDQPVGAGFSYTGKGCYAENLTRVRTEFYSAVVQFYQLFPELVENKFFIVGQSYGGHFVPALGHTIHRMNPSAEVKINLSGLMIGNGWMDILYQSDFGSHLHQLGLIDDNGRDVYYSMQEKFHRYLELEEWDKAQKLLFSMIGETYEKYVGKVSIYNYLTSSHSMSEDYETFINTPEVRKSIHIGNTNFTFMSAKATESLGLDFVFSVKPWVEELLEHYFIIFYSGQLDVITGYPQVSSFLKGLHFSGKDEFKSAPRYKWCVGTEQAGYFKGGHNLYDVMVRNAGHIVPADQPHWAYVLVNSVTSSVSDNPLHALDVCPEI